MFKADDWMCSGCGNMNWARRDKCNMCNGAKPGTVDLNREGVVRPSWMQGFVSGALLAQLHANSALASHASP